MQKWKQIGCVILSLLFMTAYSAKDGLDVESFADYQKEFKGEDVGVCSTSSVKTYEDYRAITSPSSKQYWFIRENMSVDPSGLLVDKDGFFGVALGSYYGEIGDRFYFTLDTGIVLPVVKVDEKADQHVVNGCSHGSDGSVLEFVIHTDMAGEYFGRWGNGLILSGNFNNIEFFRGNIEKVEKVTDEKNENYVTYEEKETPPFNNEDIFAYDSAY